MLYPGMQGCSDSQYRALYRVSRIVGRPDEPGKVLGSALGVLCREMGLPRARVCVKKQGESLLRTVASYGVSEKPGRLGTYAPGQGVVGLVFSSAKPLVVPRIRDESMFPDKTGSGREEVEDVAFLGVPIIDNGAAVGVLSADRRRTRNADLERDLTFLSIVSAMIAPVAGKDDDPPPAEDGGPDNLPLREMEKRQVLAALEKNGWVQTRAAQDLGITLRQMGYRIKKFGLEDVMAEKRSKGSPRAAR